MLVPGQLQGLVDIVIHDLVVDHADADAAFPGEQAVHGISSHPGGQDAVESGRGSASLDAAQDLGFRLESGLLLNPRGKGVDVGVDLLGNDDHGAFAFGLVHLFEA